MEIGRQGSSGEEKEGGATTLDLVYTDPSARLDSWDCSSVFVSMDHGTLCLL